MNSLNFKNGLVLVALLASVQSCAEEKPVDVAKCFAEKTGMQVAKVDQRNHRIFAIPEQRTEEAIISQIESSEECFRGSSWSGDWSISLFAEEKYAGYKDEKHIIPYHQNNEWAEAYLGEYDGAEKVYTGLPALKQ